MPIDHGPARRTVGAAVARTYADVGGCAATGIGGSVARGSADEHSDVDLIVFWRDPPPPELRRSVVTAAGGSIDLDWADPVALERRHALIAERGVVWGELWPYEDDEWAEHFHVDGLQVGVSGFALDTVESWIDDLVVRFVPHDDAQMLAASILDCDIVSGSELITRWQHRLRSFPDGLRTVLVASALEPDTGWWSVDMLAQRNDRPALDILVTAMAQRIIRALLALNSAYLPDPRPKWTGSLIESLEVRPDRTAQRLADALRLAPVPKVDELQMLLFDTLDLIEASGLHVDVPALRTFYSQRRVRWRMPE